MVSGYRLVQATPAVEDYLRLRSESGLSPRSVEQAVLGLAGTWAACSVIHEVSGECVAMGRVIGDGGWYFVITDMATLPGHQRNGLGGEILEDLLSAIRAVAPSGAFVNLLADAPGRSLYARYGFNETAPLSIGMALILNGSSRARHCDEPGQ